MPAIWSTIGHLVNGEWIGRQLRLGASSLTDKGSARQTRTRSHSALELQSPIAKSGGNSAIIAGWTAGFLLFLEFGEVMNSHHFVRNHWKYWNLRVEDALERPLLRN